MRPVGSSVTLTCTVCVDSELSQALDLPVTVNTVWTGPAEFTTVNTSFHVDMQDTISKFNSTATISSFEREQSGLYTCTATLNSTQNNVTYITNSNTTIGSIQVTTGETVSIAIATDIKFCSVD